MKKIIALLCVMVMVLALCACGKDDPTTTASTAAPTAGTTAPTTGGETECSHVWGEWEVTTAATETEAGLKTRTCTLCNEQETEVIPALGGGDTECSHVWGQWEVTTAATETEAGLKTRTCTLCGQQETEVIPALGGGETECNHANAHLERLDLSEYGACGGTLIYATCDCGQAEPGDLDAVCDFEYETISESDTVAEMRAYCQTCGLEIYMTYNLVEEGCVEKEIYDCKFSIGDTEILRLYWVWEDEYHDYEYADIDLSKYGACGGTITVRQCASCGEIAYISDTDITCNVDMEIEPVEGTDENGYEYELYDMTCPDCGLHLYVKYSEGQTGCVYEELGFVGIYMGDTVIMEYSEEWSDEDHDYVGDYTLYGDSCEDGWKCVYTCSACGDSYTDYDFGHDDYEGESFNLSELGFCSGWGYKYTCGICGQEEVSYNFWCSLEYQGENEQGYEVYVCPDCGLTMWSYDRYTELDNCQVRNEWGYVYFDKNGNELERYENSYTYEDHDWQEQDTNPEGYAVEKCANCGMESWYKETSTQDEDEPCLYRVTYEYIYYDADGNVVDSDSYSYWTQEHDYKGTYTLYGETCDDGWEYSYRCTVCGEGWTDYGEGHDYDYEESDLSDYDICGGYAYKYTCMICKQEEEHYYFYCPCYVYQEDNEQGYEVYACTSCGATIWECYSETDLGNCLCRVDWEQIYFDAKGNRLGQDSGSYEAGYHQWTECGKNEEGYEVEKCLDCGMECWLVETYTPDEDENCWYEVTGEYVYYDADGNLVDTYTLYSYWDVIHDYQVSYTPYGDACDDGWECSRICKVCGDDDSYAGSGHDCAREEIDLEEMGFCAGWAWKYICNICGDVQYSSWYGGKCNFKGSSTNEEGYVVGTCTNCGMVRWQKMIYVTDEPDEDGWYEVSYENIYFDADGSKLWYNYSSGKTRKAP